jgi:hypothetical protein
MIGKGENLHPQGYKQKTEGEPLEEQQVCTGGHSIERKSKMAALHPTQHAGARERIQMYIQTLKTLFSTA